MKIFRPRVSGLLWVLVVLIPGQLFAQAADADALVRRLEAKYNEVAALRAEFTQTMSSAYSDLNESFSGTLLLQGPRYRVETRGQTMVTDGAVTWIYNADENQVLINQNEDSEEGFSIDRLFTDYSKRYSAGTVATESLGGRTHFVLTLTPKDPDSFFSDVTVWMRADDAIISRIKVVDQNETTMLFDLKNVSFDPELDPSSFTFSPPKGAEVIDLRS